MFALPRRSAIRAVVISTLVVAAVPVAAPAAARAPLRDCGDIVDVGGAGAFAIAAQGRGLTCATARGVVKALLPKRTCSNAELDQCTVRGFNCFVAAVGKELSLVRCANRRQTKFVRFEFGS